MLSTVNDNGAVPLGLALDRTPPPGLRAERLCVRTQTAPVGGARQSLIEVDSPSGGDCSCAKSTMPLSRSKQQLDCLNRSQQFHGLGERELNTAAFNREIVEQLTL